MSIDENLAEDPSEVIASADTQEIIGDDDREEIEYYDVVKPGQSAVLIDHSEARTGMWIEADNPTGNFTFILNNQTFYNAPIEWDSQNKDYRHYLYLYEIDLKPGINNLTFIYTGDDNYKPISEDFTIEAYYFDVYAIPTDIKIYGNYSTRWTVDVGDKTGSVCVLIDDEVYMNDTIENLLRDYGTSNYTFRLNHPIL